MLQKIQKNNRNAKKVNLNLPRNVARYTLTSRQKLSASNHKSKVRDIKTWSIR